MHDVYRMYIDTSAHARRENGREPGARGKEEKGELFTTAQSSTTTTITAGKGIDS